MLANSGKITEVDKKIISILTMDASISNFELSKKVELSPSACLARTNRLKELGVIKQYTAIVDEKLVGMGFTAFSAITLAKHDRKTYEGFIKHIQTLPNVLECYNVSGDADFVLKIVTKNAQEFRNFSLDCLMSFKDISKINTSVIFSIEKQSFSILQEQKA